MTMTREILVAGALGCAICALPGTARALSCADNLVQVPVNGERDVPTNTLIWAHGRFGGASAARLIGPEGEVAVDERFMPVAIAPGAGTNFPVLVPRAELAPNTRYAIEIVYDHEPPSEDVTEQTWFTTGTGPATSAPPLPELVSIEPGAADGFSGRMRWLELGFGLQSRLLIADTASALGSVSSAEDLFVADGAFESVELTPTTRAVRWMSASDVLAVGRGDCLIWPEVDEDQQTARFGALDLAGNFSGWITADLELPSSAEADEIIAAYDAEQQAQAEEAAHRPARESGWFENHNTGCSIGASGGAAPPLAAWTAAIATLLIGARRRRAHRP
ncbi:MAG TPA: hypothetical protein VMG12_12905 [Polyangiaceae bacterium]|nr:hypothetical protein [Polyangiaceae bacterium]